MITADRLAAYDKALHEQSQKIRKTEAENLKIGRRRKRGAYQPSDYLYPHTLNNQYYDRFKAIQASVRGTAETSRRVGFNKSGLS